MVKHFSITSKEVNGIQCFLFSKSKKEIPMKLILSLIVLAITSSAGAQVPQSARFSAPVDAVWQAAIETIADSHFEVQSSEKASGAIWLKPAKQTVGVNDLLPRYTTKKKGRSFLGVSNWTAMQISGSVTVKESQSGSTDVVRSEES